MKNNPKEIGRYFISALEKVPGVGILAAPLGKYMDNKSAEVKREVFENLLVSIGNTVLDGKDHLSEQAEKLGVQVENVSELLIEISSRLDSNQLTTLNEEHFFLLIKESINTDINIKLIDSQFQASMKEILEKTVTGEGSAEELLADFKTKLQGKSLSHIEPDTKGKTNRKLIFSSIIDDCVKLNNIEEKIVYANTLLEIKHFNLLKDWIGFLTDLNESRSI